LKYANQYLQSAIAIIDSYDGAVPLAGFLKNYFAANKKFGSKDRKHIAQLCFAYYRLGHAAKQLFAKEAIQASLQLAGVATDWASLYDDTYSKVSIDKNAVFPFSAALSDGIDLDQFVANHFIQPDVFLRIRPGKQEQVMNALQQAGIGFHAMGTYTLAVAASTKLDNVGSINKDYVIQDYSSQQVGVLLSKVKEERLKVKGEREKKEDEYNPSSLQLQPSTLSPSPFPLPTSTSVWDCCAASGGKSILAKDVFGDIDLTVSDIRPSILQNLKKRFSESSIFNYQSSVIDLTKISDARLKIKDFDLVICDAPCTGSGTWTRTPEQLYFFKASTIDQFQHLQQKIILNTIGAVKKGGYYLYITCSAFKKENEEQIAFIQANSGLQLVEQQLIKGYTLHADTMFAALLRNKG
jgi:16S rRNA (cytosine967-C5)-methyltransferase